MRIATRAVLYAIDAVSEQRGFAALPVRIFRIMPKYCAEGKIVNSLTPWSIWVSQYGYWS